MRRLLRIHQDFCSLWSSSSRGLETSSLYYKIVLIPALLLEYPANFRELYLIFICILGKVSRKIVAVLLDFVQMRGGGCPNFFHLFTSAFLVNKRSLFPPKCFKLQTVFRLYTWPTKQEFCLYLRRILDIESFWMLLKSTFFGVQIGGRWFVQNPKEQELFSGRLP